MCLFTLKKEKNLWQTEFKKSFLTDKNILLLKRCNSYKIGTSKIYDIMN